MAYWLKLGYFTAAQEGKSDYWMGRTWVSDGPGRKSPRWNRRQAPEQGDLHPPYGPQYAIGDRLVVYVTGLGVCPAILEVEAEPRWDPGWVDEHGAEGEGDQWGVVTDVTGLWSLDIDDAPSLEEVGLTPGSVQRKGHIKLEDWQYRLAEGSIAGGEASSVPAPAAVASNVEVPVEQRLAEGYEIAPPSVVKRASRREALLVGDFQAHLEAQGDKVSRNRLKPPEANSMHTDLFNQSRGQLIEAKADGSRHSIRMAIGQLADYRRFIEGVTGTAVLLGAKPHPDLLELLDLQGIATVWRSGEGFADSAAGAFV